MFTPKGLSVSALVFLISAASSAGVGNVNAVSMPSAPALETAATNSARESHIMPPWVIGYSMPRSSVMRVLNMVVPPSDISR